MGWEATDTYGETRQGIDTRHFQVSVLLRRLEARRWDEAQEVQRRQEAEKKR